MKFVFLCHHRDQLITKYKGNNHAGDGDHHRLGKVLDQRENAAIPSLRCLSHLTGDRAYFIIDFYEHGFHTGTDETDKDIFDCLRDPFNNGIQ